MVEKHSSQTFLKNSFLIIFGICVAHDLISRVFIIFHEYDLFYRIAETGDIFALYFIFANPNKEIKK
jgi:hypothetical protein